MKKIITMVALAAISFGSVYAHGTTNTVKSTMQTDTTKKKDKTDKPKKDSSKKDTTVVKHN